MEHRNETSVTFEWRTRASGGATPMGPWTTSSFRSYDEGYSINHFPLDTDADDGGRWHLHRAYDTSQLAEYKGNTLYEGKFGVGIPTGYTVSGEPDRMSDSELDASGTTAIARVAPTNPAFDMSTALGELASDGIPAVTGASLLKERARLSRSAGGEYLNVQFGWLPLLSDIRSFAKTVKDSEKILNQYRRDSGMKIRRGFDFPGTDSTIVQNFSSTNSSPTAARQNGNLVPQGTTVVTKRKDQQWFKGAFKYHIPVSDDVVGKFRNWASMSDHLLGWKVTPETLWNIAPWSWATDWFANTGDILANVSNLGKDGLVMQYGYSMSHRLRDISITSKFGFPGSGDSVTLTRNLLHEWKQRRGATPYGFGVDLNTLTSRQIAIIAALGLSKT